MKKSKTPVESEKKDEAVQAQPIGGSNWKDLLSVVSVVVVAVVLALGLITFVFQSYQVSGISMEQTLHNGDHLIVWKVPRSWAKLTGHAYVPKRGDVIVLKDPPAALTVCGADRGSQLVKRVIGLPGDRVVVANGVVTIFNKQHPNGFLPDKTLPYHEQITEYTSGDINIRLSQNEIYVMGDNRLESCDSRLFGPVELNQVVGQVALRILPTSQIEAF
jgi:signal peptidase I